MNNCVTFFHPSLIIILSIEYTEIVQYVNTYAIYVKKFITNNTNKHHLHGTTRILLKEGIKRKKN